MLSFMKIFNASHVQLLAESAVWMLQVEDTFNKFESETQNSLNQLFKGEAPR